MLLNFDVEVPTVSLLLLWELADELYQLLFCFWPPAAAAAAAAAEGQLGRGPAAPTLYCGWSALLGEVVSSSIRDLNYLKSRPILLFPASIIRYQGYHVIRWVTYFSVKRSLLS